MYVIDNRRAAPGDAIEVTDETRADPEAVLKAKAFKDSLRTGTSTSYQRLALRCELTAQDYSPTTVTPKHRQLFEAVGIAWNNGANLDTVLRAATRAQAGELLRQLKGRA